ncbi:MAG TPA: glycosyltransferase family 4 protein [Arachnia sp.]|nr:glycosyltransferase family 4 protein [Arachnia sp.]
MSRRGIVHLSTVHRTRDNRIYNKECGALLDAGFDVTLVVRADGPEAGPVPVVAMRTPSNRLARLTLSQAEAWRHLARLRPGLVHIHDPELIPLAWIWARTHGAKWVFDAHENLVKQIATKPYLKPWQRGLARAYASVLTGWADRGADGIVAATDSIAGQFRNPRTAVVFNYPWLRDFAAAPSPVPGRLVYAGDLTEERKLSFMLEVTHRLRERVPSAHLLLAGKLVGARAEAVARLIDGDVVRHLGLLPPREVPPVIASAQVGLIFLEPLPNYVTSLPTKLYEYMAAGVPFAASDFAFWRDTFGPLDAGVFVDSANVSATVDALAELLEDPSRCAVMGARGRAAVEDRFTFEAQALRLVELVERLGQTRR